MAKYVSVGRVFSPVGYLSLISILFLVLPNQTRDWTKCLACGPRRESYNESSPIYIFRSVYMWYSKRCSMSHRFPNVGMTITLRLLGDLFQSEALYGAQLVMTLFVCSAYIVALSCTILAFCQGKILLSSPSQVLADKDQPRGHHGKERPMIHISPPFNKRYSPVNFH